MVMEKAVVDLQLEALESNTKEVKVKQSTGGATFLLAETSKDGKDIPVTLSALPFQTGSVISLSPIRVLSMTLYPDFFQERRKKISTSSREEKNLKYLISKSDSCQARVRASGRTHFSCTLRAKSCGPRFWSSTRVGWAVTMYLSLIPTTIIRTWPRRRNTAQKSDSIPKQDRC